MYVYTFEIVTTIQIMNISITHQKTSSCFFVIPLFKLLIYCLSSAKASFLPALWKWPCVSRGCWRGNRRKGVHFWVLLHALGRLLQHVLLLQGRASAVPSSQQHRSFPQQPLRHFHSQPSASSETFPRNSSPWHPRGWISIKLHQGCTAEASL